MIKSSAIRTHARAYRPIGDYAIVGDARSAALVASDGGMAWLCLPPFDLPALLCRILDEAKGGFLDLDVGYAVQRTGRGYRASSNVIETWFQGTECRVNLTDVMPFALRSGSPSSEDVTSEGGRNRLVRLISVSGDSTTITIAARIAYDYGSEQFPVDVGRMKELSTCSISSKRSRNSLVR